MTASFFSNQGATSAISEAAPRPKDVPIAAEADLQNLLKTGGNVDLRISGDLRVKGHTSIPGGFVVEGSLHLADGCELDALVVIQGDVTLGEKARVLRALVVRGNLTMGKDARIPACHVDGDATLQPGATIESSLTCRTLYLGETTTAPSQPARDADGPYGVANTI